MSNVNLQLLELRCRDCDLLHNFVVFLIQTLSLFKTIRTSNNCKPKDQSNARSAGMTYEGNQV